MTPEEIKKALGADKVIPLHDVRVSGPLDALAILKRVNEIKESLTK